MKDEVRERAIDKFSLDYRPELFEFAYAAGERAGIERAARAAEDVRDGMARYTDCMRTVQTVVEAIRAPATSEER